MQIKHKKDINLSNFKLGNTIFYIVLLNKDIFKIIFNLMKKQLKFFQIVIKIKIFLLISHLKHFKKIIYTYYIVINNN
jgi:hypothetical protein